MAKITIQEILILIAIIVGVGIYIDLRKSGVLFGSDVVISRDTIVVNLPQQTFNLPPSQPINIINNPIPSNVDTGAILKAFFSELTYLDSLENDTVKIVLKDVVTQNSIRSRQINWKLKVPLTQIIETRNEIRPLFYYGAFATYGQTLGLSPMIGYRNKREQFFFGAYDPITKGVSVGGLLPLKK